MVADMTFTPKRREIVDLQYHLRRVIGEKAAADAVDMFMSSVICRPKHRKAYEDFLKEDGS